MIRLAKASDADAVRTLVREAYGRWVERFGREPSPMRDDYDQRIAADQVWVLEEEGEAVGLIVLRDGPESILIQNVAVAPSAQSRGHGRRLMTFGEKEAKRRGYSEVRLYVNALMVENVAFYQHLGFVEIERVHDKGRDQVYVYMGKPVS
jgi:ribosomal protein S18 acetylase RimI-like enzyme